MKYYILLLASLFVFDMQAQKGITFEENSKWETILAKAKAEDKVVFVDAYTTWCGPCKMMSRSVFPMRAVGKLYNDKFINVKIDMEKGEGLTIAQRYGVRAYPTYLFVDGDGTLVHRSVGYKELPEFLELGRVASDPMRRMSGLDDRYAAGEKTPAFLYEYATQKAKAMDPIAGEIARKYLATQKDWSSPENMTFVFQFVDDTKSPMFDYLVENKANFISVFGDQAVLERIQNLIYNSIYDTKEESGLEQISKLFKKVYPEKADEMISHFKIGYYRQANDKEKFVEAALDFFKRFPNQSADEINQVAWTFYEMIDNPKQLKQGVKLAKKSIKVSKEYYNVDTLAALYYKLGKQGKAKKAALKAIELAEENRQDSSSTKELLKMIELM